MVMKPFLRGAKGDFSLLTVAGWPFLLLLGLLTVTPTLLLAAGLEAQVDRTRLAEGESLLLTLSGPGDVWGTPDTGPLARDFGVQNQGQGTSTVMSNGRVTTTREWRFLLTPKASGRLTIPAIRVGDLESLPIAVEVLPAAQAAQVGEAPPARLEAELDHEQVYVQGQVIYTLRILLRPQVQNASLEDPTAEGVQIERLGEDRVTEVQREGLRFRQIERRYALLPQHSGAIAIQPPVLSAAVPESRGGRGQAAGAASGSSFGSGTSAFEQIFGRDPFAEMDSLFQRTRPIQVRGPALTLEVKPQLAGAPVPWLPAEDLRLAEDWTPDPAAAQTQFRVGEPITRTLAITAQGLSATQLPDLIGAVPPGVKSYPDKPRTETRAEGSTLVAIKEIKQALVPTVAGKLVLPEIRLAWWDTRADRERVAVLPSRTLEILPALGAAADQTSRAHGAAVEPAQPAANSPSAANSSSVDSLPPAAKPPPAANTPVPGSAQAHASQASPDADPAASPGLAPDTRSVAATSAAPAAPDSVPPREVTGTGSMVESATPPGGDGANLVPGPSRSPLATGSQTAAASPTASSTEPLSSLPLPAGPWPWLALAFAFLWLTTLLLWWWERNRRSPVCLARAGGRGRSPDTLTRGSLATARDRVRQACQAQAPRATREALLTWGQVRWPEDPPRRLDTLATRLGGNAATWMGRLDQCLYAPGTPGHTPGTPGDVAGWDGPAAWRDLGPALEAAAKSPPGQGGVADPLPPLYPHPVAASG